jgi:hypothetical protein
MKFNIVGSVYYTDGFDFTIEAASREEAEEIARCAVEERPCPPEGITLQEICIESVEELP